MKASEKINVLSLFDGISCGKVALENLGININKYYSSEIDKYAIEISNNHHKDIIRLGDVLQVKSKDLPKIDLLIGGSPCQNLSITVINNIKHNKGLDGGKSELFYEFVRLLQECKPKYFLLENVGSMKNKDKEIISAALGVQPIKINSNLFSAQDRSRYYWTNIPQQLIISTQNIVLKDIVEAAEKIAEKYWYNQEFIYNGDNSKIQATLKLNGHDILKRVYNLNGKCGTLTCCRGGNLQKKVFQNNKCRKLIPLEYERLQTLPDNYTQGISDSQRYNCLGNCWTIKVIEHLLKGLREDLIN